MILNPYLYYHTTAPVADRRALFGLSPKLPDKVIATIGAIHASGTAVMLIEQNVGRALAVAQRAYVIELGQTAFTGAAAAIADDLRARMAILGGDANPVLGLLPEHRP